MKTRILALVLLCLAPFASAQVVINPGGGGIASGSAVPSCTINSVVYIDASGNLACGGAPAPTYDSTNIRLQVGTGSTTQQGWYFGYRGTSGVSAIWTTDVTPGLTNYILSATSGAVILQSPTAGQNVSFNVNNTTKAAVLGAVGSGFSVTAGTATTDVQALSTTQTWNNAGVSFTGHKYDITNTASAGSSLHSAWSVGGSTIMSLTPAGALVLPSIYLFTSGSYDVYMNRDIIRQRSTGKYGWASSTDASAAADTTIEREAAATIQMGADVNGAAIAQTFKAADGITGTDIAGANLTIAGGRGTGAGAGGNIQLQTSPALATGTTAQTLQQRDLIVAKQFNLTSGAAATIAVVTLGNDTQAGGTVQYCIYGADATTAVSECGSADFNGVDVTAGAGGEVCTFTKVGTPAQAVSGATLATTFAATTGTDLCNLRVTSTITTIASPVNHYIKYRIINHGLSSTNVVTPQ